MTRRAETELWPPEVTGFQLSRVITNPEVVAFLDQTRKFLEAPPGLSLVSAVGYRKKSPSGEYERGKTIPPAYHWYQWQIEIYGGKPFLSDPRKEIEYILGHEVGHIFWEDHLSNESRKHWMEQYSLKVPEDSMPFKDRPRKFNAIEDFCDTFSDTLVLTERSHLAGWRELTIGSLLHPQIQSPLPSPLFQPF